MSFDFDKVNGAIQDELESGQLMTFDGIDFRLEDDKDEGPLSLMVSFPMHLANDREFLKDIRNFAIDCLEELFSNRTNNDTCRITLTETSEHYKSHADLHEFHNSPFGSVIILQVQIEDYLT